MVRVLPGVARNYPVRLLDEMKLFLAVLDDIVGACFPMLDGKADIRTMLLLSDQRGSGWAETFHPLLEPRKGTLMMTER